MKDIRQSQRPWVAAAVRRLDAFNRRHWWDHNAHFHAWVLRRFPAGARTAIDLGCGQGLLVSRLAERIPDVTGIDRHPGMVAAATALTTGTPGVTIRSNSVEEVLRTGTRYDVVTMIAVLHHLDLESTITALPRLLDPGGRLLVVGLSRTESILDLAVDLASTLVNPLVGLVKRTGATPPDVQHAIAMPMRDPEMTFADIRRAASRHLPGARLRRRLFFRYTLEWTAPGRIGSSQSMW
jgi:2-polyprenyl-3-methyl-5-hydroxy-6-metoxy-1,4-benzoquinol methylase